MPNINDQTIQLVIIGVAALAVVMQAIVLIAILFAMKKAAAKMQSEIQELRASVMPMIHSSSDFIANTAPRIEDFISGTAPKIEDFITSVAPKLDDFITNTAPKIESTATDVAEIVHTVREKTSQAGMTMTEMLSRAQRQTARVDGMVTTALDSVERVGGFLDKTVSKPVKQISALVAAGRAVVQSLNATSSRSHSSNGSGNHDPLA
jgi:methyl-accepting chemotaxis protein